MIEPPEILDIDRRGLLTTPDRGGTRMPRLSFKDLGMAHNISSKDK